MGLTWNCGGALRKKVGAIDRLESDLLVIQECEDPSRSTKEYATWAGDYLWHGLSKNKGIGVFSRASSIQLSRLDWQDDALQSFLPCTINNQLVVVGVWTKYANSPNFRYIGQLWKYLKLHKERLASGPFIICGDLNSNTRWDEWDRWWNHTDVVREIEELGGISVYHNDFSEEQGNETRYTLFHRRSSETKYHIDYSFVERSLLVPGSSAIGDHAEWIGHSDHMPLTFSIDLPSVAQ